MMQRIEKLFSSNTENKKQGVSENKEIWIPWQVAKGEDTELLKYKKNKVVVKVFLKSAHH